MHLSVKLDLKIDIHLPSDIARVSDLRDCYLRRSVGLVTATQCSGTRTLVEDEVNRVGV